MRAIFSTAFLHITLTLCLTACGGSDAPPPVAIVEVPPQLSIVGEDRIAAGVEHRLYAVSDAPSPAAGPWQWRVLSGAELLQSSASSEDVFSFSAVDIDSVHSLTVSVTAANKGTEIEASKTMSLHPADDETQRPLISVENNREVDEGTELTLFANTEALGGRSIRKLLWQQLAGPLAEITGASDQDQLRLVLPQVSQREELVFRLRATDSGGFFNEQDIRLTLINSLPNQLPVVDAGQDRVAFGRERIVLVGQATDNDGEVVALEWRALPPFDQLVIDNADSLEASFVAPNVAETSLLQLRLRATDNEGAAAEAELVVTLHPGSNHAPEIIQQDVDPGVVYAGETAHLTGLARDADGDELSYLWQLIAEQGAPEIVVQDANNAAASFVVPPLSRAYSVNVLLTAGDGREQTQRTRQIQILPRQQAEPDIVSCVQTPLQKGCPLYPLADLLDPSGFSACADPLNEACIFADLAGPALRQCLQQSEPEVCRDQLAQLYEPSYVLEQLGREEPADSCNPAYDEQSFEHYIGALHEHTGYSDGTPLTRPADVFREVAAKGYDFVAISDHSDTLHIPFTARSSIDECLDLMFLYCVFLVDDARPQDALAKWAATLNQSAAATSPDFTAIRGFEWTSDRFGHINVYFSRNFINAKTGPGYAVSMANFWQWFTYPAAFGGGSDGLLSFNHPGREDFLEGGLDLLGGDPAYTFNDFRFVPAADYRTVGVEVFGKGSEYDSDGPNGSWLSYALDKGWHLAPISSEDHHGLEWGEEHLPKTVLIARSRSLDDLREAMLARRAYAVAQYYGDVRGSYSVDGHPMGSRVRAPAGTVLPLSAEIRRDGRRMSSAVIQLVGPGNRVYGEFEGGWVQTEITVPEDKTYLFLRVLDASANRRPIMFSAPVWLMPGSEALPNCLPPEIWQGDSLLYPALP